ncbi:MAG: alanine racemase, partial [Alphaproteobacteria bacterium]
DAGYGQLCDATTMEPFEGVHVGQVSQEHGVVPITDERDFDRFPVGGKVRIQPNHACMTAAAYPAYNVVENMRVVDEWDRVNGW